PGVSHGAPQNFDRVADGSPSTTTGRHAARRCDSTHGSRAESSRSLVQSTTARFCLLDERTPAPPSAATVEREEQRSGGRGMGQTEARRRPTRAIAVVALAATVAAGLLAAPGAAVAVADVVQGGAAVACPDTYRDRYEPGDEVEMVGYTGGCLP